MTASKVDLTVSGVFTVCGGVKTGKEFLFSLSFLYMQNEIFPLFEFLVLRFVIGNSLAFLI